MAGIRVVEITAIFVAIIDIPERLSNYAFPAFSPKKLI